MKTVSYATLALPEAIKLTADAPIVDTDYETVDLDGDIGTGLMIPSRTISATLSSTAAAFVADSTITIVGLDRDGLVVTEDLVIVGTGGAQTLVTTQEYQAVTKVTVAAQVDKSPGAQGTIEIGVQDVVLDPRGDLKEIRVGGTDGGDLKVEYGDGSVDTITNIKQNEHFLIEPTKIYGDSDTTATDLVLFFRAK